MVKFNHESQLKKRQIAVDTQMQKNGEQQPSMILNLFVQKLTRMKSSMPFGQEPIFFANVERNLNWAKSVMKALDALHIHLVQLLQ